MSDDLPDFHPLRKLPFESAQEYPLCDDGPECRWYPAKARALCLSEHTLSASQMLYFVAEMLRAHDDNLIADVIEDSIMYLCDSVQPYLDAHLAPEEA